jgi:hypothetical protein
VAIAIGTNLLFFIYPSPQYAARLGRQPALHNQITSRKCRLGKHGLLIELWESSRLGA